MKDCKSTFGNTLTKSIDIKELEKQTCLNILIVKVLFIETIKIKGLARKE
jgi:hypothetical protein